MSEETCGGGAKEVDAIAGDFFLSFLFFSFAFDANRRGQTASCVFPPSGHLVFAPALVFFFLYLRSMEWSKRAWWI